MAVPGLVRCASAIAVGMFGVGGGGSVGSDCLASPKSRTLAWPRLRDEDVRRLDVPVHDAAGVRGLEGVGDLRCRDRAASPVSSGPGPSRSRSVSPSRSSIAMNGLPSCSSTSWIVQMLGCWSEEAARASRCSRSSACASRRQLLGQELQRDAAAELQILGLVDDAHAAAAELREDAVVRDRLADHGGPRFATNSFCRRSASSRIAANSGSSRIESKSAFRSMAGYAQIVVFDGAPQEAERLVAVSEGGPARRPSSSGSRGPAPRGPGPSSSPPLGLGRPANRTGR